MGFCKLLLMQSQHKFGEYHKTTQAIQQVLNATVAGYIERLTAVKIVSLLYYDELEKTEQAED